jgi:hypothetical protein
MAEIRSFKVSSAIRVFSIMALASLAFQAGAFEQTSTKGSPARPAASTAALPSVDQVLDKYVVASGGRAAWQKLNSRVSKGTVDLPAMNVSGTLDMREKAPDRMLVRVTISGSVFSQGFDGHVGWSSDPQNGLHEQTGAELAETKREADFYHLLDFRKIYPKISVTGTEKLGEHSAYVVEATPPEGGEPDKIYFDTQTSLPIRVITQHHDPDGSVDAFQEDFEEYHTVDGVKIPFTIHQSNSQVAFTIKIDEVRHNVDLDDGQFAKPAAQ